MVEMLEHKLRILVVILVVARIFSLHLPMHLANSYGSRRIRMLNLLVATVGIPDKGLIVKVLDPTSSTKEAIVIETLETPETEILGGTVTEKGAHSTPDLIDLLGGTNLLGGTKTRPNVIGTIVLGGTLLNRPRKGVIENGIVHRLRVTIKQPA